MACVSGNKCKATAKKVTNEQLSQALEYFNLPEYMWPTGLNIIHTQGIKYDKVASQLMATIKAEIKQLVASDRECAASFTNTYYLHDGPTGLYLWQHDAFCCNKISQALQSRLQDLAAAECLDVEFPKDQYMLDGPSMKITVRIP